MLIRWAKLIGLLIASWCVLVVSHEAGHLIGGWAGGGMLQHADLRPWALPHSRFDPDPSPLVTLWAGPVLGVVMPLAAAATIRRRWSWFIAKFCLLANGMHIALGLASDGAYLDAHRLLAEGAALPQLIIYALLTIGFGYDRFRLSCIELLTSGRKT